MITRNLLFVLALAGLSSCATYRTGQTPDDVYYSPEKVTEQYVEVQRDRDDRYSYNENRLEDQRLWQQIRDPRFRTFNDDFYWTNPGFNSWNSWNTWNSPWGFNQGFGWNNWNTWNSPWGFNHGFGWNSWNSPYFFIPGSRIIITNPGSGIKTSTGIRYTPSIQTMTNGSNNNRGSGKYVPGTGNGSRYFGGATNNSNRSSSIFSGSSSGGNNRTINTGSSGGGSGSRTFSSGSSGSSSGGSNSGSRSSGNSSGGRRN